MRKSKIISEKFWEIFPRTTGMFLIFFSISQLTKRQPHVITIGNCLIDTYKYRLNNNTSPQNFWTVLENDLTKQLKKSAVANAISISLPLMFFSFVSFCYAGSEKTWPDHFIHISHISLALVAFPAVLHQ